MECLFLLQGQFLCHIHGPKYALQTIISTAAAANIDFVRADWSVKAF